MSGRQESRSCQICEQHSGAFRQTREHLLKNLRVLAGQVTRTATGNKEGEGEGAVCKTNFEDEYIHLFVLK
jgi:hypothetical protein